MKLGTTPRQPITLVLAFFSSYYTYRIRMKPKSSGLNKVPTRNKASWAKLIFLACVSVPGFNDFEYYWSTKKRRPCSWFIPVTGRIETGISGWNRKFLVN